MQNYILMFELTNSLCFYGQAIFNLFSLYIFPMVATIFFLRKNKSFQLTCNNVISIMRPYDLILLKIPVRTLLIFIILPFVIHKEFFIQNNFHHEKR